MTESPILRLACFRERHQSKGTSTESTDPKLQFEVALHHRSAPNRLSKAPPVWQAAREGPGTNQLNQGSKYREIDDE